MRIAIDIRKIGSQSTGSETYFYHLVKELAGLPESKKHDFTLLTDKKSDDIKKILNFLPDNFKIYQVTPTSKLFWTFYSVPRFFKKHPVDIFHTEYIVPFQLTKKIKIVTTVHDISFKVNPKWIAKRDALALNTLIPPSIKRADAIIGVSNFSKEEIEKYYHCPADKVFAIHPAVEERYFRLGGRKEAEAKVAGIIGNHSPFILHISSLQPRKNVPLIISAFGKIKKDLSNNLKLVIVGKKGGHNYDLGIDEEIHKQIKKGCIKDDDITITGYQSTELLPYFYQAAKICIFPSSYEGFGLPIVESMASGTPVVASNIKVFKEIAGNAATLINIGSKNKSAKLASAIKELLENNRLREEKIKTGMEQAKNFSWKKMAEQTMEIYKSL